MSLHAVPAALQPKHSGQPRYSGERAQPELVCIAPQPGFQTQFLSSQADITIGGGAAGCGKTRASLIQVLRHINVDGFSAVFFRRTMPQVTNPGGLWSESMKVFPLVGGRSNTSTHEWRWPTGSMCKMASLEHETSVLEWQGAQIALIIFDELTHFAESMFWYMFSRNRSVCGVRPYMMATCNPDADSWVAKLIAWWIDQETGYPIPERAGKLRWFTRRNDQMIWGDTREEVKAQAPDCTDDDVKSLTFIPGTLDDNPLMNNADPGYRGRLMALPRVQRERLLGGNWKIRPKAGDYFQRSDVTLLNVMPTDLVGRPVRAWDLAATEPSEGSPDPDWTAGVKMQQRANGRFAILHVELARKRSGAIRELVKRVAALDTRMCKIHIPQDPGQAGVDQTESYTKELATAPGGPYVITTERVTGPKETRAEPLSAQWQAGNVDVVQGPWLEEFFHQMEGFPSETVKGKPVIHDDCVDAAADAFTRLVKGRRLPL